jgi:enoyl-CoA hydratase
MTKQAVNRAVDLMGQDQAIEHAFALHHLCHANNLIRFGTVNDPAGLPPTLKKR